MKIILASRSPRRRGLLERLELPFSVTDSGIEEEGFEDLSPRELVDRLAREKARAVAAQVDDGLIIGADTSIDLEGTTLGKPRDFEHARQILEQLRDRTHQVLTGVAVHDTTTGEEKAITVATDVRMASYSDTQITAYIESGEPMDKAGAYGIQGKGGLLVAAIDGCYYNVIGLPLCEVCRLLLRFGVSTRASEPICILPSGGGCPRLTTH